MCSTVVPNDLLNYGSLSRLLVTGKTCNDFVCAVLLVYKKLELDDRNHIKVFLTFSFVGEISDATQRNCMIMVKPELHSLPKSNQNRKTIQGNSGIRGHILDSSAKSYVLWERSNTVVC